MTTVVTTPTMDSVSPPPRPDAETLHWTEPPLASLTRRSPLTPVVLMLGAVACASVDVLLMYPAVARVLRHSVALSWLTAAGIGLVALLAAGWSGWSWRGARGNHAGSTRALILPVTLLASWAAAGLGVMKMRLSASSVTTAVMYEGATSQSPTASFDGIAAYLFLVVYIICGVLAFSDLYERRNDAFTAGRGNLLELNDAQERLAPTEAVFQQLLVNVHKRRDEIRRLSGDAKITRERNALFAAELKQLVRGEMAVGMADPTKTGITSPRHPENPASGHIGRPIHRGQG